MFPVSGIRDDPECGVRRSKIKLDASTVGTLFPRVLDEVIAPVKGQIRATETKPKAVLLVGGFGQSPTLQKAISDAVRNDGIEVIQPPNGYVYSQCPLRF